MSMADDGVRGYALLVWRVCNGLLTITGKWLGWIWVTMVDDVESRNMVSRNVFCDDRAQTILCCLGWGYKIFMMPLYVTLTMFRM
ncbi:hypothetical protein CDAR_609641 [Caerostris darwini]|uniref:Uncharacterized protein n=1 Tax=Caerostris darwini TaxID=1538125 RepID=A0AAV4M618_9ARAC|nr:hypothetical protein CDAR_609641 [Caerostris darwini]